MEHPLPLMHTCFVPHPPIFSPRRNVLLCSQALPKSALGVLRTNEDANVRQINSPECAQQLERRLDINAAGSRGGTRESIREPSVDVCSLISMYSVRGP